jgi:hypothetical protein
LLAFIAAVSWLAAFGLFAATFVSTLVPLTLQLDGWPFLAAALLIIVLAKAALAASGLRGKEILKFFSGKPTSVFVVQVLLLGLWLGLGGWIPPGKANGDVCVRTEDGIDRELSAPECEFMRMRFVRCAAGSWMTIGWLAVAQFVFARRKGAATASEGTARQS